jgi:hypothetical protein
MAQSSSAGFHSTIRDLHQLCDRHSAIHHLESAAFPQLFAGSSRRCVSRLADISVHIVLCMLRYLSTARLRS